MKIDRRDFLKRVGLGSLLVGAEASLQSCTHGAVSTSDLTAPDAAGAPFSEAQIGAMTYRTNPNTGDRVSLLGYGMMRLPELASASRTTEGSTLDQEAVNALVDYALAHGVNYFDTSPAYCKGFSEQATGIALARHPRKDYFIATKLSNFSPQTWSREASQQMFQNSLRYLKTSYVDYLLLHGIGMPSRTPDGESLSGMEAFQRRYLDNGILDYLVAQKKNGIIRNLGFSYHGDVQVFDTLLQWHDEGRYHWDFVQIQMNYVDYLHAREQNPRNTNAQYLYDELQRRGIPAVIMEPLLGGRLSKLPNHIVNQLKSREPQRSVASWAFRFCGTFDGVLTALSGMTYLDHLQDNLRSFAPLTPLTADDMAYLEDTAQQILRYPLVPCNDCKYCMPCPYGLDIPGIFVHYNKCVNEGTLPKDAEAPDYERLRKAYLVSYSHAVPTRRQADHCVGCHQCEAHCPQNIKIAAQMERIYKAVEDLKQHPQA